MLPEGVIAADGKELIVRVTELKMVSLHGPIAPNDRFMDPVSDGEAV